MLWVAPPEKDTATDALEKRLWDAADQLRANGGLNAAQYSTPVQGLIFLRFADVRFARIRAGLEKMASSSRRGSRVDEPAAYHAEGVLYLTPNARFEKLLHLPEGSNAGKSINEAMRDIEKHNPQLAGVLPKTYEIFNSTLLKELLKRVSEIPATIDYDAFGRIYEYFLGEFARTEGQKGGEFYTPSSIVRLLVEVLEPYHGRILDPACGSGGMFVQSARFVAEHKKNPSSELAIHGQEKVAATVALCRMNLAMHGLEGDIKEAITYYDDLHKSTGRFDFVLANPPFNVNAVDKERLEAEVGKGRRYPFGLPRTDNANYLWIQLFYSALSGNGRAGFVMANSASDARSSEQDIRKQLIEARAVDVMVAVGPNMFYTVTLPCTLWFMDKAKAQLPPCPPSPVLRTTLSQRERVGVASSFKAWWIKRGSYARNRHPPKTCCGSCCATDNLLTSSFAGSTRSVTTSSISSALNTAWLSSLMVRFMIRPTDRERTPNVMATFVLLVTSCSVSQTLGSSKTPKACSEKSLHPSPLPLGEAGVRVNNAGRATATPCCS